MSRTSIVTTHSLRVKNYFLEKEYLTRRELVEPGGIITSLPWPSDRYACSSPKSDLFLDSSSVDETLESPSVENQSDNTIDEDSSFVNTSRRLSPLPSSTNLISDESSSVSTALTQEVGPITTVKDTDMDIIFIGSFQPERQQAVPENPQAVSRNSEPTTTGTMLSEYNVFRSGDITVRHVPKPMEPFLSMPTFVPMGIAAQHQYTSMNPWFSKQPVALDLSRRSCSSSPVASAINDAGVQQHLVIDREAAVITREIANKIVEAAQVAQPTFQASNRWTQNAICNTVTSQHIKEVDISLSCSVSATRRSVPSKKGRKLGVKRSIPAKAKGKIGASKTPNQLVESILKLIEEWDPENYLTGTIQDTKEFDLNMDTLKRLVLFASVCYLIHWSSSESIPTNQCSNVNNVIATVQDLRVDPCPAPGNGSSSSPCSMRRGRFATLSVDFTPEKDMEKLRAALLYVNPFFDFPFSGMESNGCKSLGNDTCPLKAGQQYTWTAKVYLAPGYPPGTFPLKLKLTDGARRDPKTAVCQTFTISLV